MELARRLEALNLTSWTQEKAGNWWNLNGEDFINSEDRKGSPSSFDQTIQFDRFDKTIQTDS